MPIYEYKCQKCGHSFEVMQRMSDPPPPCPAPAGLPGTGGHWADFWAEAKRNFDAGKKTLYPAAPTWVEVGPEFEHNVIRLDPFSETKKTLGDWLAESPGPCGGEVVKQISRSSVHFKGSGFYATDYKK